MDRRQAPRRSYVTTVIVGTGTSRFSATTIDASRSGVALLSRAGRSLGGVLGLSWQLQDGSWLDLEGVLVRSEPQKDGQVVFGVRFTRLDARLERELASEIRRSSKSNHPTPWAMRTSARPKPAARLEPVLSQLLPRNNTELANLYRLALAEVAGHRS
jgi:hypothetical protein